MNIFAVASLVSCLINLFFGGFIYSLNPKSRLNKIYMWYCLMMAYWGFTEFMYRQAESPDIARLWMKISCLWPFSMVALVSFALVFTEKVKVLRNKLALFLIYGPALAFSLIDFMTNLIATNPLKEYWGYTPAIPRNNWIFDMSLVWAMGMAFWALFLCAVFFLKTADRKKKRQAKYVTLGLAVTILIGAVSEALIPLVMNIRIVELTAGSTFIASAFIGYAIWKYDLFSVTPMAAAENIISIMPDSLLLLGPEGNIIETNPSLRVLLGYETDELHGVPAAMLFAEKNEFARIMDKAREHSPIIGYETKYIPKSGKPVDVSANVSSIRGINNEVIGYIITARDITERNQTETRLKESEIRFRTLFESAAEGILVGDVQTKKLKYANPALCKMLGYSEVELMQMSMYDIHPKDGLRDRIAEFEAQARGEKQLIENIPCLRKDGQIIYVSTNTAMAVIDGVKCNIGFFTDMTHHKNLEDQLRQTQKIESIGQLAGGIAHDFNNILTVIQGYASLLQETKHTCGNAAEVSGYVSQIYKASERAASLTRQILAFSRKQPLQTKVININQVVDNLSKMIPRLIGENIELDLDLALDLKAIKADPAQIEQVIMNLVVNARDAMPNGGILAISTENAEIDNEYCKTMPESRPGRFIKLFVSDTGIGMSPEIVKQIFEPFFTTKKGGQGTGLGLSVAYGIIKQHNGWVNVYSNPGQGAIFKIYLPVTSEAAKLTTKALPVYREQTRDVRILIVEDEPAIRDYAEMALKKFGYTVFKAGNADEALAIFENEQGRFDLVFSDVVLPGKNGIVMVQELISKKPDLKVLMTSGYTDDKSQWPVIADKNWPFIQKPYTASHFIGMITKIIEGVYEA
ncbi:MAG: PAS domain S-box protein [Planctomycetota bacterium]